MVMTYNFCWIEYNLYSIIYCFYQNMVSNEQLPKHASGFRWYVVCETRLLKKQVLEYLVLFTNLKENCQLNLSSLFQNCLCFFL